MTLVLEDLNTYRGNGDVYPVTNERVSAWDELLEGIAVYKAAAICSGGEVAFFNLLPRVRTKLVLIDHSYQNMYFAMVKYLLLQKYGAAEAYKRITEARGPSSYAVANAELASLATEVENDIPEAVRDSWSRYDGRKAANVFGNYHYSICPTWGRLSSAPLTKTCAKLHKVTFVHGDLTDLTTKGKFGLVYLSNALEHTSRTGSRPLIDKITAIVKPGGYVLTSERRLSRYYSDPVEVPQASVWERIKQIPVDAIGTRSNGEMAWSYNLYRTPLAA